MFLPDFELILLVKRSTALAYKQLVNMNKDRGRPPKES